MIQDNTVTLIFLQKILSITETNRHGSLYPLSPLLEIHQAHKSLPDNHRQPWNINFLVKITLRTMCNTFWLILGLSVLRFSPISVNVINFLQAAINLFDTRVSPRSKIVFKFHDLNKTVTPPIFSIHICAQILKIHMNCCLCVNYAWITRSVPGYHRWHQNMIFFIKKFLKSFLRQYVTYFVYIIDLSMLHFSPISVNRH